MKATGEVMAIDRTFGSALNKALRGLEQAGVGPLAEDPTWTPTFDYLAAVYAGDPEADAPIRWIDERGEACESTRFAQRSGAPIVLKRFLGPSDSRLWRLLGLLRRGVPEAVVGEATGISAWFLAEMGRNVALEHETTAMGARLADASDAEAGELLATVKRAGFGDKELAGLAGVDTGGAARRPAGPRHRARATRWSTPAPPSSRPRRRTSTRPTPRPAPCRRRRPSQRPAALVIGSGPVRIGQGIEFDYCAVQAADTLRQQGWQAVMINSNPETVSTDFDASSRLYFEPLDPESVRSVIDAESPGGADGPDGLLPAVVAFGGQTPLNLAAPLAAGGVPLLGSDLEAIDQAEERVRFSALLDRLGIPQPEGGMAHSVEEALTLAERIGYPVIVRPSFVIGGLAIDFCYSPEDLERQLGAGHGRRPGPARPHRPLPRGHRGRRRRGQRRRCTCSSRACSSTSSGPASTAATASACSRRRPSARATRTSSWRRWSGSCWRSGRGAWSTPSSSSATTACTSSRSTRAPRGPSRSCPR